MVKLPLGLRTLKRFMLLMLLIGVLIGNTGFAGAEPTPLTPAAVKYELEHAKSVEAAAQHIQQQSQDYKSELAKSPTPIPNAAKNAQQKTKGLWQLFNRRVQETVTPDESQASGERS
jgi:hypothetical protein